MGRGTGAPRTSKNAKGAGGPKTGRQVARRGEPGFVYNRVRFLRAELGASRAELAEELGIGFRTLGYLERERYESALSLAWEISEHFGLPMEVVFSPEPMRLLSEMMYGGGDEAATTPRGEP